MRHPAQRRTLVVLALAQALGGVGNGVALGVGSLLVEQVTGEESLAGLAATLITLGGAIVAVPLARLAAVRGRRPALALGALIGLVGTATLVVGGSMWLAPVVLCGFLLLGASTAVNLQSRFAATDLSEPSHRARDLSLVVWMTTIGVVVGPNLVPAGDAFGAVLGMPPLVGAYGITALVQALCVLVLGLGLRPDPLLEARGDVPAHRGPRPKVRTSMPVAMAIVVLASGHATMVGVMALTPVHLGHEGVGLPGIMLTMSAHTAGMYMFAPVFGLLADRIGRTSIVLVGFAVLAAAVLVGALLPHDAAPVALALLGLGWSAVTVPGSALVAERAVPAPDARPGALGHRAVLQGRADLILGLTGAAAGAAAGPLMGSIGYQGLSFAMGAFVVIGAFAALAGRSAAIGDGDPRQSGSTQTASSMGTPPPASVTRAHPDAPTQEVSP